MPRARLWKSITDQVAAIRESGLFNESHYRSQVPLLQAHDDAIVHYLLEGEAAGLTPSPAFAPDYYRLRYPIEVAHAELSPLLHFIYSGQREKKRPLPLAAEFRWPNVALTGDRPVVIALCECDKPSAQLTENFEILDALAKRAQVVVVAVSGLDPALTSQNGGTLNFAARSSPGDAPAKAYAIDDLEAACLVRDLVGRYRPQLVIAFTELAPALKVRLAHRLIPVITLARESQEGPLHMTVSALPKSVDACIVLWSGASPPDADELERISASEVLIVGWQADAIVDQARPGENVSREREAVVESSIAEPGSNTRVAALTNDVWRLFMNLQADMARMKSDAQRIADSGLFSLDLYRAPFELLDSAEGVGRYVRTEAKGLDSSARRAVSGFISSSYVAAHPSLADGENLLINYLRSGRPDGPWKYDVLEGKSQPQASDLRVAVHGHFFYPELVDEFVARLLLNASRPDLYISVAHEDVASRIRGKLAETGLQVDVRCVPNRGRDIGPFLVAFKEELFGRGYDVVGHFHGKRSLAAGAARGESWRTFLWEHLLGGPIGGCKMDMVLNQFSGDDKVGIVIAEEPYRFGWHPNLAMAREIGSRMGISEPFLKSPEFPVGTMFWCRPQAMRPILELGLGLDDLPAEPVGNDGTMLHALERLLVVAAEHAGYTMAKTRVNGLAWFPPG